MGVPKEDSSNWLYIKGINSVIQKEDELAELEKPLMNMKAMTSPGLHLQLYE
eukprot:UN04040